LAIKSEKLLLSIVIYLFLVLFPKFYFNFPSPSFGLAFSIPRIIYKFSLVSYRREALINPPFTLKFRVYQPKIDKKFNINHKYSRRPFSGLVLLNISILIRINKIFFKKNT
jgi:hypothetical protein